MMLEWLTVHYGPGHPKTFSGNFPKYQHPYNRKRGYCRDCGMTEYAMDARSNRVHPPQSAQSEILADWTAWRNANMPGGE